MNNTEHPRTIIYFLAAVLVTLGAVLWSLRASDTSVSEPKSRTNQLIAEREAALRQKPGNLPARLELAEAYLQKVRETSDNALYVKVEELVRQRGGDNVEDNLGVIEIEAAVAAGRHDFRRSLGLAETLVRASSTTARYFGLLGDAQIELGQYDAALESFQAMVDLRPDFASRSRVAYARELYGDVPGAIEAMRSAEAAGSAFAENMAWARAELGRLYFYGGNIAEAKKQYAMSLQLFQNYTPGLRGLARIAWAESDESRAFSYLDEAVRQLPIDPNYTDLADLHAAVGNMAKAEQLYAIVKIIYAEAEKNGVNVDLEYAQFLADHRLDLPEALGRARRAYGLRPNVHAADVLSWTLYQSGQYREANHFASEARKLGSQDPAVLFHGGMIAKANENKVMARKLLARALELNPKFSYLYSDAAKKTLAELNKLRY